MLERHVKVLVDEKQRQGTRVSNPFDVPSCCRDRHRKWIWRIPVGILSSFLVGMGRRFLSNPLTCHVQMKENNTLKQMCARTAVTLCENAVHVCTWQKVDSSSGGKTTKGHKWRSNVLKSFHSHWGRVEVVKARDSSELSIKFKILYGCSECVLLLPPTTFKTIRIFLE